MKQRASQSKARLSTDHDDAKSVLPSEIPERLFDPDSMTPKGIGFSCGLAVGASFASAVALALGGQDWTIYWMPAALGCFALYVFRIDE
jgi:hypothetical protein